MAPNTGTRHFKLVALMSEPLPNSGLLKKSWGKKMSVGKNCYCKPVKLNILFTIKHPISVLRVGGAVGGGFIEGEQKKKNKKSGGR